MVTIFIRDLQSINTIISNCTGNISVNYTEGHRNQVELYFTRFAASVQCKTEKTKESAEICYE